MTTTTFDDVQLLSFWPSPFDMRARLALTAKGIPFTTLPEDFANKSSLLLQSNPVYKKIPVLLHQGKAVCESIIIVQYIDEAFPSRDGRDLLPKDPYERAVACFWGEFIDKKLQPALISVMKESGDARKAAVKELKGYFNLLEEGLATVGKESPYFGGANLGFVDIILGPVAVWYPAGEKLAGIDLEVDRLPRLAAWMRAFQQSTLAESLPQSEKLVEHVRENLSVRWGQNFRASE